MTDGCGYQKGGAGVCNSTIFGYPFEPLNQMLADTPKDFKKQTVDVIGSDATAFKDSGANGMQTRAASLLTFVCPFFLLFLSFFYLLLHLPLSHLLFMHGPTSILPRLPINDLSPSIAVSFRNSIAI
jgi:hypothetical protein